MTPRAGTTGEVAPVAHAPEIRVAAVGFGFSTGRDGILFRTVAPGERLRADDEAVVRYPAYFCPDGATSRELAQARWAVSERKAEANGRALAAALEREAKADSIREKVKDAITGPVSRRMGSIFDRLDAALDRGDSLG